MIKIAICDDNPLMLQSINNELSKSLSRLEKKAEIKTYTFSNQLLSDALESPFDLVLLDIEMPKLNGFQLAEQLRSKHTNISIFFITDFDSKVYQSYEYEPLWFIRKSELKEMLPKAVEKFFSKMMQENEFHIIKSGAYSKLVRVSDIMYFECSEHRITATSTANSFSFYGSLRALEKEFEVYGFIRIHKNYLVNRKYIFSIDSSTVVLIDSFGTLPLSREKRNIIKSKFFERS